MHAEVPGYPCSPRLLRPPAPERKSCSHGRPETWRKEHGRTPTPPICGGQAAWGGGGEPALLRHGLLLFLLSAKRQDRSWYQMFPPHVLGFKVDRGEGR